MTVEGTQLGVDLHLPEGWQEVPLSAVADVRFSSVDKLTFPSEKLVRLCNYIDVYKNDYIKSDLNFMQGSATQGEIERFGLQVGDVIITKDSETPDDIAIPAVVDDAPSDLVCGYHLALLRLHRTQIDATFLARQLGHHRLGSYFARRANGLTRYGLSLDVVSKAPIWLPTIKEQAIIGRVARLVDAAISAKEGVIAKLKQMKAGLLHDLFTRGLDANGELRDPVAHPEQFKESALGRIPGAWEVTTLGADCSLLKDGTHLPPKRVEAGPLLLSVQNMIDGQLRLTASDTRISWEFYREFHRNWEIKVGDILIAIVGATLGKIAVVPSMPPFTLQRSVAVLRGKSGELENSFLSFYLSCRAFQSVLWRGVNQTAQPGIYLSDLSRLGVPKPTLAEQRAIVEVLNAHDARIRTEEGYYEKLKQVKRGLMQDLLTGKVCVNIKHEVRS